MARSNLVNAVDVALADPVGGADPTIRVTDPGLLPPVPFYLVVDPFSVSLSGREYMLATAIVGDVLTVSRNLAGSESTTHDAGEIVRITYVAQHLDDIFDEIDLYLPLTGGTLTGTLGINRAVSVMMQVDRTDQQTTDGSRFQFRLNSGRWQFVYGSPDGSIGLRALHVFGPGDATFSTPLIMNGNRIQDVANPLAAQDAATQAYVDGFLPLTGGTMVGNISMGLNSVVFDGGYSMAYFTGSDFAIWSQIRGERVLRFMDTGQIFLRPFNDEPLIVEGSLDMTGNPVINVATQYLVIQDANSKVFASYAAGIVTLSIQAGAILADITTLPSVFWPIEGSLHWTAGIFTGGFIAVPDLFASLRIEDDGVLSVTAVAADSDPSQLVINTFTYVARPTGL